MTIVTQGCSGSSAAPGSDRMSGRGGVVLGNFGVTEEPTSMQSGPAQPGRWWGRSRAIPYDLGMPSSPYPELEDFIHRHRRILVLTGAGCSTASGIPAYRDRSGTWQGRAPVTWQAFRDDPLMRQRYWGRSVLGWPSFGRARPNPAHYALAQLEAAQRLTGLITQNVDGLHQAAGHREVIDLHGRLDTVVCLQCGVRRLRAHHQRTLESLNPGWLEQRAALRPDGDVDLDEADFAKFTVPTCGRCGGMLKPDVVFFGEMVPVARVAESLERLERSDALLVVGTSLMVYSGLRYVRKAAELGLPIASVNQGKTRADPLITVRVDAPCAQALNTAIQALSTEQSFSQPQ